MAHPAIVALDGALTQAGEDIVLRRTVGTANQVSVDVECRAVVRSPNAQDLIAGFAQTDSMVIISPTPIARAQWPGGHLPSAIRPEIPRADGPSGGPDKVKIQGRFRNVLAVSPFFVAGELVRIEMRVKG